MVLDSEFILFVIVRYSCYGYLHYNLYSAFIVKYNWISYQHIDILKLPIVR